MPEGTTVSLKLLIQAVDKASKTVASLEGRLNQVSAAAERLSSSSKKSGDQGAKSLQKMDKAAGSTQLTMEKLADSVAKVSVKLLGLGASISAPFAIALTASSNFEQGMSKVLAVTSNAQENFEELKNTAAELGRTTRFTATEAAEGMTYLGQAGFDAKEVITGIGPTINLAVAAAVDLGNAANIASNVISALRLPISDLNIVVDVLAKTAAESNAELIDMAEAISYAGPVASAVGVNIQDLASLVGVLGNAGIQGSRAGTALRSALFQLTSPTQAAKDSLEELGVELKFMADGSLDLIDVFHQLADAQVSAGQANEIFGRYATAGVLAITSQIDALDDMVASNHAAAGAAEEMAKIMKTNLKGSMVELRSAVDGFRIAIGDKLLPVLTSFVKAGTAIVSSITGMLEKFPVLTSLIVTLTGSFGLLVAVLGSIGLAFAGVVKALSLMMGLGVIQWIKTLVISIRSAGVAAAVTSANFGVLNSVMAPLQLNLLSNIATFGKFKGSLLALRDILVVVGGKIKALFITLLSNPLFAITAGVTAVAIALLEWDKRLDTTISKNKQLSSQLRGLTASFSSQVDSLLKMEKGSEKYIATTKNLEKQLIKVAEENDALAEAALRAANAIDDVTGEIVDGGEALEDFIQVSKELELNTLTEQVELLEERYKRLNGESGLLSSTLQGSKTVIKGVAAAFADFFDVISGGEGGRVAKVFDEQVRASEKIEKFMDQAAQAAISRYEAFGQIDMTASSEEMKIFFENVLGLTDKTASTFITQFEEMQEQARSTAKEVKEIEQASTGELTISVSETVEEVRKLRDAYENAAKASELLAREGDVEAAKTALQARVKANQERLEAEKSLNNKIQALRKQSFDDLKEDYDKELGDLKRQKDLEIIEEWDFNQRKADLDVRYSENKISNLKSIVEQANKSGATELKIFESLSRELTRLDKEYVRRSETKRDTSILHANQIKEAIEDIQKSTENINIELTGSFNVQQEQKLLQEISELERRAAKIGLNDREVIEKAKAAITRKYARQTVEYHEDLRQAQVDGEIALAQESADRQVEALERAFERGEITAQAYVDEATERQIEVIDAEIEELYKRIEYARNVLKNDPLVLELEIRAKQATAEKEAVKKDADEIRREAIGKEAIDDLQEKQTDIESKLVTTPPDTLGSIEERNKLELELLRNKHQQIIQEMTNNGVDQVKIAKTIGQQLVEVSKLSADQVRDTWEAKMNWGEEMAGTLSTAFSQMYEITGKKSKEFFYLQKAAALAEATIQIAKGISTAWGQQGAYGYIGAAIVASAGAVQLATIASQTLATGGKVKGSSPHKKADNIPAMLTANEWVQPVDTVKYYGEGVMEALRKRLIPREVFSGYQIPVPRYYHAGGLVRLAEGGSTRVQNTSNRELTPVSNTSSSQQKIDIVNVVDQNMMQRYVASNVGKQAIFNVIRSNAYELRNAMVAEG